MHRCSRKCVLLLLLESLVAIPNVVVDFTSNAGKLKGGVKVGGKEWLTFSPELRVATGKWNSLKPGNAKQSTGSDELGSYSETEIVWSAGAISVSTSIRTYSHFLHVCTTKFLEAFNRVADANERQPLTGFPSFQTSAGEMPKLGFALWTGLWPEEVVSSGLKNTDALSGLPRRDGPIIFTSTLRESLVIGPVDDLLNTVYRAPSATSASPALAFGPSGRLGRIDAGYSYSVAFVPGDGPAEAMKLYGNVLRKSRGLPLFPARPVARLPDLLVSKLSYWTDNGAWFFPPNLQNPSVDIPQFLADLEKKGVSVGGLQLDGWWPQNPHMGPNPKYFPDWNAFQTALGNRGLLLYKSFFAHDDDVFSSVPCKVQSSKAGWWYPCGNTAEQAYAKLFSTGKALGMTSYETDFMSDHMLNTDGLANTTTGLPSSLAGMAAAGKQQNMPMQWCMPTAGTVLSAVDKPAVTNARGTVDYGTEGPEKETMAATWKQTYNIGVTGLLFWIVDLPLSKDLIWTSANQPGMPKGPTSQPNFEMDAALAVLSMGPVGFGDGPNFVNVSLLKRTCRADGTILKPSKPVTAIDSTFVPSTGRSRVERPSANSSTADGQPFVGFLPLTADGDCTAMRPCSPAAYQTYSTVSGLIWHQLLSMHLGKFVPKVADFYPAIKDQSFVVRESRWSVCRNGSDPFASKCAVRATLKSLPDISTGPHRLDATGAVAWKLFTFSPVLANGWVMLGETDKFVPVSPVRFSSISVSGKCLAFTAFIANTEVVTVGAISPAGKYCVQNITGKDNVNGKFC